MFARYLRLACKLQEAHAGEVLAQELVFLHADKTRRWRRIEVVPVHTKSGKDPRP